jgi:ribonuclease-3
MKDYTFANKLLCAEAAQMASPMVDVIFNGGFRGVDNNKRLAILGDAVLQKVLCAAWFKTHDTHGRKLHLSSPSLQI